MNLVDEFLRLHHAWRKARQESDPLRVMLEYQREHDPLRQVLEALAEPMRLLNDMLRMKRDELNRVQFVIEGQPPPAEQSITGDRPAAPWTYSMFVDAEAVKGADRSFDLQIPLRLATGRLRIVSAHGEYVLTNVRNGQDSLLQGETYEVPLANLHPSLLLRVDWDQVRYGRDWIRRR